MAQAIEGTRHSLASWRARDSIFLKSLSRRLPIFRRRRTCVPATASLSSCAPSTQASQITVAYSGNASNCFSRTIHPPGFGSLARVAGGDQIRGERLNEVIEKIPAARFSKG